MSARRSLQHPAERDSQENGFLNTARMEERHSHCPSFWKFESIMFETSELQSLSNCVVLGKIGAMFIITVYSTASARDVPDARSRSPKSSSHALTPDSTPSVCSQKGFTGIMIFCIKAFDGSVYLCIRRHASAPLDSLTERTMVR